MENLVGKECRIKVNNFDVGITDKTERKGTMGYILDSVGPMLMVEFKDAEFWWYAKHHLTIL